MIIEDDFDFSQALIRTRLLRENGKYIPKEVGVIRRERVSFMNVLYRLLLCENISLSMKKMVILLNNKLGNNLLKIQLQV